MAMPAKQLPNPLNLVRMAWRNRELIIQLTRREIGQRYRGSYLGFLWSLITPLFMLVIYTIVFAGVFQARWQSDHDTSTLEFALIIFAGLAAFNFFSEVVNQAPMLILNNPNYVKKVVFPLEILPIVTAGSSLINSLIVVALVILGNFVLLGHVSVTLWLFPVMYLPLFAFTLGAGWLLASVGVYIRDIGPGIGLILQVLFFTSGVFFSPASAPEPMRSLLAYNPLTFVLTAFRQTLIWGEWPDWPAWLLHFGTGLLFMALGYSWFTRTKKGFADVM